MADVIIDNHHLLSIINRFGIQLGFGEKSVEEVCKLYNVEPVFFTEIINTFSNPDFFPKKDMKDFSFELIINYLRKTHKYYLTEKIPEIKNLIDKLYKSINPESKKSVLLIKNFFNEYAKQLKEHIDQEEKIIYPYILKLDKLNKTKNPKDIETFKQENTDRIIKLSDDHIDIEQKLYDIKSLIIKYIKPDENYIISFKILGQITHLLEDIDDHSEMEDRFLFPRIQHIESLLFNQ